MAKSFRKVCKVLIETQFVRVSMSLFLTFFNSKSIYKTNEDTNFCIERTFYKDYNLLWRYAFWQGPPERSFNNLRYTNIPTAESGVSYQHSEINTKFNTDFWISWGVTDLPIYDIEPPNRESEDSTGTIRKDFEPVINFGQDIKKISWQKGLNNSSNSSSTSSVSSTATSVNSGNAFEKLSRGENHYFRIGKECADLVDT